MGVVVGDNSVIHKVPVLLQKRFDVLVSLLDIPALEICYAIGEFSHVIDWADQASAISLDDTKFEADTVIILTEGWRLVDHTCAGVGRDVCIGNDTECLVHEELVQEVIKRGLYWVPTNSEPL